MKTPTGVLIVAMGLLVGCASRAPAETAAASVAVTDGNASTQRARQARTLAEAGDTAGALRLLDEAVRLDPDNPQAVFDRAVLRHATGEPAAAMADIDRAVILDPANVRVRSARCVIQVTAERNSAGLRNCYHAMVMPGPAAEAQTALGQALLVLGRPREALGAFDNALRADPEHMPARYGRGLARQRTGDADGASDTQAAMQTSPWAARSFAAVAGP